MNLPIKQNIDHLKATEKSICDNYGLSIELVIHNGLTNCTNTSPICKLIKPYNTSDNPACPVCKGRYYVPLISTYNTKAVIHWITQNEIENKLTGGDLQVGDCILEHISYDSMTYFENAIINKVLQNIDGMSLLLIDLHPTIIKTSLNVTARRFEPRKGAGSN